MNLPDFLIIGAMKCGTTTLAAQIAAQPGYFMTVPKEPNYFSDDNVWAKGKDWYSDLFSTASDTYLKGEASTHYTKLPTYPETVTRLSSLVAAPKMIYMIRDPVTRAVSHYIHGWSRGEMSRDPAEAFERHPELVEYGRYGMQIAPFIDRFGAGNVLLTSLEQLLSTPQDEFARIGDFLGKPVTWKETLDAQNVSAQRSRKMPFHKLLIDHPVAETLRRTLVPKSFRRWIREGRRMADRPELPAELRKEIEAVFLRDRTVLAGFFQGHPALDLCYTFRSGA